MKYIIIEQIGSIYWLEGESLMYAPIRKDDTFNTTEGGEVDEDIMQGELLPEPYYSDITFDQLYRRVRYILKEENEPCINCPTHCHS